MLRNRIEGLIKQHFLGLFDFIFTVMQYLSLRFGAIQQAFTKSASRSCIMHSQVHSLDFCCLLVVIDAGRTCNKKMAGREYLDNVPLFQGCSEKMLDSISVLLREVQV